MSLFDHFKGQTVILVGNEPDFFDQGMTVATIHDYVLSGRDNDCPLARFNVNGQVFLFTGAILPHSPKLWDFLHPMPCQERWQFTLRLLNFRSDFYYTLQQLKPAPKAPVPAPKSWWKRLLPQLR